MNNGSIGGLRTRNWRLNWTPDISDAGQDLGFRGRSWTRHWQTRKRALTYMYFTEAAGGLHGGRLGLGMFEGVFFVGEDERRERGCARYARLIPWHGID